MGLRSIVMDQHLIKLWGYGTLFIILSQLALKVWGPYLGVLLIV